MAESSNVGRRRFLKYVGAGLAAAAAGGAGYYLYGKQPTYPNSPTQTFTIPKGWETATTWLKKTSLAGNLTNPPVISRFDVKPSYINPTSETTIRFSHSSYDPDNDPLSTTWLIDGEDVSHEPEYSTKLSEGDHSIVLKVSDGKSEAMMSASVTVEPDQMYPPKQLHIKHKGMRMTVGWKGMSRTPVDITDEKLDIIRDELGCNAVIIYGNTEFEDDLIEAGRLAIEKGFDRIYVAPMYLDVPIDDTVEMIGKFAKKVRTLREVSDSIVFMVGHEFSLDAYGIIHGETYSDRTIYLREHWDAITKSYALLPSMFRKIIERCNDNYGYQIAYAATMWEAEDIVPWSNPIFESVSSDAYVMKKAGCTEDVVRNHLSGLKRFRKPVNSTEWGCPTYNGAGYQAASDFLDEDLAKYPYDEDEQAKYIAQYCNMLNRAKISGAFYTQIDDERLKGYGLYKASPSATPPYFGHGSSRKKGFYIYKSYQRAS